MSTTGYSAFAIISRASRRSLSENADGSAGAFRGFPGASPPSAGRVCTSSGIISWATPRPFRASEHAADISLPNFAPGSISYCDAAAADRAARRFMS